MTHLTVRVQSDDFDLGKETVKLNASGQVGAIASFVGLCRDEGGRLEALELEHYPGMAEAQIEAVAKLAGERWPLDAVTVIHRYGRIAPGERIVLVLATSVHRDAAFDACRFVMDYLKTDAPFWKKEWLRNGSEGAWVEAKETDEAGKTRWG